MRSFTSKPHQNCSKMQLVVATLVLAAALAFSPLSVESPAQDVPDENALAIMYHPQRNGTLNLVPGGIEIIDGAPRDRLKIINTSGQPQPPLFIDSTSPKAGFHQLFVKGVDVTTVTLKNDLVHGVMVNSNVSTITLEEGGFQRLQLLGTPGTSTPVDLVAGAAPRHHGRSGGRGLGRLMGGRPVMLHIRQPFNSIDMPESGRTFIFATNYGEDDNQAIGSEEQRAIVKVGYLHNFLIFRNAWIDLEAAGARHIRGFRKLDIKADMPHGAQTVYGRNSLTADIVSNNTAAAFMPPINVPGRPNNYSLWHLVSSGPVDLVADLDYGVRKIYAGGPANIDIVNGGDIKNVLLEQDAEVSLISTGDLHNIVAGGVLDMEGFVANAGQIQGDQGVYLDFAAGWEVDAGTGNPVADYTGSVGLVQSNVLTSGTLRVAPDGIPTVNAPTDNLTIITAP